MNQVPEGWRPVYHNRVTYLPLLYFENVLTQHIYEHVFLWTKEPGPRGMAGPVYHNRVTYLHLLSFKNVLTLNMQEHVFL